MSNINPGHVRVFQAIRSQLYDNITLASCTINGEPGVAIIMIDEVGEGKVAVMPLFVAITSTMEIAFPAKNSEQFGNRGSIPTITSRAGLTHNYDSQAKRTPPAAVADRRTHVRRSMPIKRLPLHLRPDNRSPAPADRRGLHMYPLTVQDRICSQLGLRNIPMDLLQMIPLQLLALHAQVSDELRTRKITRSSNNPTGDLAEYLFCKAFGWTQADNSKTNIDALGADGTRYQIKGRRLTRFNKSRQLSAIRDLDGAHFDLLAGVLFSEDYTVLRAAIIPRAAVVAHAVFVKRTNSHKFHLRDDVWHAPDVIDVTPALRAVIL
jgi:hypothetical protein